MINTNICKCVVGSVSSETFMPWIELFTLLSGLNFPYFDFHFAPVKRFHW